MPMQTFDLKELAEKNPGVDTGKVKEAIELVAELRKHGVRRASYQLLSPYDRTKPAAPAKPVRGRGPKVRSSR